MVVAFSVFRVNSNVGGGLFEGIMKGLAIRKSSIFMRRNESMNEYINE